MARRRFWQYIFVQTLTFGRAPLILIFLLVSICLNVTEHPVWFCVAFGAMVLSTLSDWVDGYFARKFGVESALGAYADPLTDKIFYLVSFPTLVYLAVDARTIEGVAFALPVRMHAIVLLLLTVLFMLRDQWVSFLRSIGAMHNVSAKANWSGKARTIVSFPTICVVYVYLAAPTHFLWGLIPVWRWPLVVHAMELASLLINMISIYVYTRYYWPVLRKEAALPPHKSSPNGE